MAVTVLERERVWPPAIEAKTDCGLATIRRWVTEGCVMTYL